jgi:hypothetical protein
MKSNVKSIYKNWLTTSLHEYIEKSKLSAKSIGILIRSHHLAAPSNIIILLIFASKPICTFLVGFLCFALLLFYLLDGCFLSKMEEEICKDNFTIMDPMLELLSWEINKENRISISYLVGIPYLICVMAIYYLRFL